SPTRLPPGCTGRSPRALPAAGAPDRGTPSAGLHRAHRGIARPPPELVTGLVTAGLRHLLHGSPDRLAGLVQRGGPAGGLLQKLQRPAQARPAGLQAGQLGQRDQVLALDVRSIGLHAPPAVRHPVAGHSPLSGRSTVNSTRGTPKSSV